VRITCISFRMDRPMSRVHEGTTPVVWLSILIIGLMGILFVVFIFFLDFAVLRRVVELSNIIRKKTLEQRDAFKDMDDSAKANINKGKKGKSSDQSGSSSGEDVPTGHTGGDEIRNLRMAVEQNTYRIRKRLEAVNDVIKMERTRILRHKQAMQLLCLWCDRNEFFPGLRPNASLLRYEPTRSLDDLLSNPLAVEYLKSHCDSDCTLENLFFLFDVSWLWELEDAEDGEQDPAKRKRIHNVAADTAATIIARYIAADAPQQINISAATFKVLRGKADSYKRGMFRDAVNEVKLMLDTDILPRFQNSVAYTAMSENLYIDSYASADDEWSSESVSTAGSVLSDEGDQNNASQMVAFNFRNLYATFDGDTDLGSTCTNELSVIDDNVTNSTITGQGQAAGGDAQNTTRMGTVSSSTKEGSEEDDDDDAASEESEKPQEDAAPRNVSRDESESSSSSASSLSNDDLMSSSSSSSSS